MALREMLAQFSVAVEGLDQIDAADKKVNKFFGSLSGLTSEAAGLGAMAGLTFFGHLTQELIKTGAEINTISNRLGVSSDELQQWRYMAEQTGAKANDLTLAFKMLQQHMADSAMGQKNKGFDHLGLQLRGANGQIRPVIDVVGDLADKVAKLPSEAEKTALALHTMGKGGIAILPLLKLGRDGVERLTKRFQELGGGLSQEFVQGAQKAKAAQIDLSYATAYLKDHIGTQLFPAVTFLTHKFADLVAVTGKVAHNTQSMKTIMLGLGVTSGITAVKLGAGIASKLGIIAPLAEGASRGLLGTAKAIGQIGYAGLRTILPLVALFLIIEDIWTFLAGGESLTGHMIEAIFGPGSADAARKELNALKDSLLNLFKESIPYLKIFAGATAQFLKDMFGGFKGYGKMFREFFELLGQDIDNWWKQLEKDHPILSKILDGVKAIGNPLDPIKQLGNVADATGLSATAKSVYELATSSGGGSGGPVVQNNRTEVNITAPNPSAIAPAVSNAVSGANDDNAATLYNVVRP